MQGMLLLHNSHLCSLCFLRSGLFLICTEYWKDSLCNNEEISTAKGNYCVLLNGKKCESSILILQIKLKQITCYLFDYLKKKSITYFKANTWYLTYAFILNARAMLKVKLTKKLEFCND